MKFFFSILLLLLFISCSTTPKSEYSRTKIDRPYALPDSIASVEAGYLVSKTKVSEVSDVDVPDFVGIDFVQQLPILRFEQGIGSSVNWIYPLGVRWSAYDDQKHMLGLSVASLLFYTTTRLDYWYRISEKFSFRPHYINESLILIIINQAWDLTGGELVYQHNEKLAFTFGVDVGAFTGTSPLIDEILEDITEEDQDDVRLEGDVTRFNLGLQYSLTANWDLNTIATLEKIVFDEFETSETQLDLSFTYFY